MPYEFDANISQLQENLIEAKKRLEEAKQLVQDTISRMNAAKDESAAQDMRNLLTTARNQVMYWSAQHTEAQSALDKAK